MQKIVNIIEKLSKKILFSKKVKDKLSTNRLLFNKIAISAIKIEKEILFKGLR